jgi:FOG: FHA domain
MVLNIISIVLQYSLIALIYYFLFSVIKVIYLDLKQPKQVSENIKTSSNVILQPRSSRLLVIDSQNINLPFHSFDLVEATSIGRSSKNDIVIDDKFVSYEHACINYYKNEYWLSDLNSTNHTYVNGKNLDGDVPLKDGDVVKIGAVTFKYER